ncbi:Dicarboxylate/amino acid:cation (Na or H) symporter (DAACS) family protein [Phytophthora cinnamomi]|uniref:Dicarboxylate/amino acid:cation (Na or H) symporter (DAACS) family protein n=1 Tax=Phytophthora cinnamomi TaxID=4785 RepID=UPI003559EAF2|nr:Dicarboxylate/amino acid:cation (Na or H) symporter (DAACS) family protein [Phytophthora cinnamomi]
MAVNDDNYQAMDPPVPAKKSWQRKVFTSLTFWIIVGMVVGIILGQFAPTFSEKAAPMKNIFLRPIQFVVFPLVFSSLVVGIADQKDMKQLGRLALKSIIYFEVVTTLALILGLFAVNIVKPGKVGLTEGDDYDSSTSTFTFETWIEHLTPKTWGEMMGGEGSSELLQVLVAAILTGIATSMLHENHKNLILELSRAVLEMMFKFVDIVIWSAPIGVCFAIADAIASNGLSALGGLGALIATVYVTIILFIVVVFGAVCLLFKINPVEFLVAMKEPLIIAYTTATSEAALPKVFEALEKYGVSTHISGFVVPFGYSFNLDGSTLYLSLGSVFCAQAAGVHKSIGEQIVMVLMLMVSSKGVAGVRSAAIIVMASTLDQFDIPSWPVALILGVDWIMDMLRTLTNVMGNCLASVVMAKTENAFRTEEWEREYKQLYGGEDKISVIGEKMSHVSAVSAVEEGRH